MNTPRLLHPIPDAAGVLGISARVVERLIADGKIQTVRIGRRRLVPHDALQAYVSELMGE